MRRRAGGGIDKKLAYITKGLKCFQNCKNRRWRKVKKVNLAGGERGILKVARRTSIVFCYGCFSMEEIYE